jgi:hypothetical protein
MTPSIDEQGEMEHCLPRSMGRCESDYLFLTKGLEECPYRYSGRIDTHPYY